MSTYKEIKGKLDKITKFYLNPKYENKNKREGIQHAINPDEWDEIREWERLEELKVVSPYSYRKLLSDWIDYYQSLWDSPLGQRTRAARLAFQGGDFAALSDLKNTKLDQEPIPTPSKYDPEWLDRKPWSVYKYTQLLATKKELESQLGFDDKDEDVKPEDVFK